MEKVINFIKSNIKIIIVILFMIIILVILLNKDGLKEKKTYTVVNGTIERSEQTNLYLIKKERVVDYDSSQAVTSIIEQGKRTSKNEVIATYQNGDYDNYIKSINDIDDEIKTLVADMPISYSSDITSIDSKILKYAQEIQNTSSYQKMQEYKTKLDELANTKINVIANNTPDSSKIRELINQREDLVSKSKTSSNVIYAPISGIVSYKVDTLENSYDFSKVENYEISDFSNIISSYDGTVNTSFGIKIVDNFEAYFLVRTSRGDNDAYIKTGNNYNIRISDLDNKVIRAYLIRNLQDDSYNYSLFRIENEIDDMADYRKLSCEVVWKTIDGMAVPLNALHENENYSYVTMVYGTQYVNVPVIVKEKSDSIAIVENYSGKEVEDFGLDPTFKLEYYDELVIE